jgi:GTP-binding protein LepA
VQHGDIVPDRPQRTHGPLDIRNIHQEVGNQNDHSRAADQARCLSQCIGRMGCTTGTRLAECIDYPSPLGRARPGRKRGPNLVVKAYEPHRIALANEQQGKGGCKALRVGQLGQAEGITSPAHGTADIQDDGRAEVGFLLELLHDPAIGARRNLPVDVAQVVARLIGAMLRELDGEPLARGSVQSGHEAVDNPARDNFDPTQRGQAGRIEEVGSGCTGTFHRSGEAIGDAAAGQRAESGVLHRPATIFRGYVRNPVKRCETQLKLEHIRNFCIVAHIDHGKSTLADRLIEATGMLQKREMKAQVMDTLDLERERGITIKLNAVRMSYTSRDGRNFELNLIDTPGHVDFTYEVSRSLNACEGAILVVDASQGIQAQTLSNLFLAMDAGLEIIPILNKIDLPGAEPEKRRQEVVDLLGCNPEDILLVSAKEGLGIPELLERVVEIVPPPKGDPEAPLRALIYDSFYDKYRGAVPSIRVVDGTIRKGTRITFGASSSVYEVVEVGYNQLRQVPTPVLSAGEVGYVVASVRSVKETRAGDTVFDADNRAKEALPGYQAVRSFVFAGMYPTDTQQYEDLRDALERLQLNDASLQYEPETSTALGFGFRCGFLGLLHMEIVQERLTREFDLDLVTTVPSVEYHVYKTDGTDALIENPALMPPASVIERIEEPYVKARIMAPAEYIGPIMTLGTERRGEYKGMQYIDTARVEFDWEFPLGEIILDFFDRLKTISRGYASLDYEILENRTSDLVKLDMLINGDAVDAFSVIIHRDKAYEWGRKIADKLKELIPRQLFEVVIQAAIGTKVVARSTVKPLRKNVLAKCYGGDISRKRKLLEKQKAGKKRMKQVGSVEIPQEAFLAVLQVD